MKRIAVTSKHFTFYFPSLESLGTDNYFSIQRYERTYERLELFWHTRPSRRVRVWIYPDGHELTRMSGLSFPHAYPDKSEIHTLPRASTGHELAHLFAHCNNPDQDSWVLSEGTATLLDQRHTSLARDVETVTYMTRDVPERDVTRLVGDTIVARGRRWEYVMASSFVAHLIREHGIAKFLSLYQYEDHVRNSIKETYATTANSIEKEWKGRLLMLFRLTPSLQKIQRLKHEQKNEEAIEQLETIARAYGDEPVLLLELGALLVRAGEFDVATTVLGNVLSHRGMEIEPLWLLAWAHHCMGWAQLALGHLSQAKHHFEEAAGLCLAVPSREFRSRPKGLTGDLLGHIEPSSWRISGALGTESDKGYSLGCYIALRGRRGRTEHLPVTVLSGCTHKQNIELFRGRS